MPQLATVAPTEPARAPELDLAAAALDQIDFFTARLPAGERRAFLEWLHSLWCRLYAREVCRHPAREAEPEMALVLAISARIARLPR